MMTRLRLFPSALALSLLVGCAGEEGGASAPPTAPPPVITPGPTTHGPDPAPTAAPAAPAADKGEAKDKAAAPAPTPPAEETKADEKKAEEKPSLEAPKADAGAAKLSDEELANVKKLPAEDQPLALAQAVCPVSDEHLGAMDAPIKETVEGRTVFLCCEGCKDELKANPKAALEKLDKLAKK